MTPADWLLLFICAPSEAPLDPVRMQKGLFLLAMEGRVPPVERYRFEPYAYGPMSRELYRDARVLEESGLVEAVPVAGHRWRALRPTGAGRARAERIARQRVGNPALERIAQLRGEVDALAFADLLAYVYELHPEYAVRSVFRR